MTHSRRGDEWSSGAIPEEGQGKPEVRRTPGHRTLPRRRRLARGLRTAAVLILAIAIAGVVWVGVDAWRARGELAAAAAQVHGLQSQVVAGDEAAAARTLASLQRHAAAARSDTRGPNWSVARALPWLGANIRAVQTVTDVIDGLATGALPELLHATSLVDPTTFVPVGGRIDLVPLVKAAPQVVAADGEVQAAVRRLDAIDSTTLLPPVAAPLADLRTQVGGVAATTGTAARAVRLIPPMLGANGPREYLLLVQNNAEQRATGGVPTLILLRAADGVVRIDQVRSASFSLAANPEPVLPLTAQELALFGDGLGIYMADVTFTPDFPRSGALARAIWHQQVGGDVDGVLSVDAGALAGVLGATGPVKLPTGQELTAGNAVALLLNTVYLQITDFAAQDAFFAATAVAVFDAVMSGQGNPAATVGALAQAARDGRLMVWSAHPDEQALLSGTVLSGGLVGVRGDSPVIGVYLNDGTAAKIGYYLRTDVVATPTACRPDGSQAVTVTVTLKSTAPANAADLPFYIASGISVPKGDVRTNVLLYAPAGGLVDDVQVKGGEPGIFSQVHDGLAVVGKTVQLRPGEQVSITYHVRTGAGQAGLPVLRVTPVALGTVTVNDRVRCPRS